VKKKNPNPNKKCSIKLQTIIPDNLHSWCDGWCYWW